MPKNNDRDNRNNRNNRKNNDDPNFLNVNTEFAAENDAQDLIDNNRIDDDNDK
ncbi:hypothetical protein H1D32_11820 [Anaerobacillus sp. CMMVII]|uniref:hypothetical protein n=1 Tax=Anaerobacillus sp. CMMVII TaxID=2755588 RepID=UPI0021B8251E|nr:hypothetical protein [Anaerobacillus sp. CMMVII]MCT8138378.1 hypothetical protein [Anaerobacillus sp. CMMVII]